LTPLERCDKIRFKVDISDNRSWTERARAQRVSATEASRAFSTLLDRIESEGGRFLIHRRGYDVCVMAPPPVPPRRASECIAHLRNRSPALLDGGFGNDLRNILAGEAAEEPPSWDS
jgi:hypothetical protein